MHMNRKTWTFTTYITSSNINFVTIGQKSSRILATCGKDKKVSLWVIGKTDCIMTLSDHISPIQSLSFNKNEDNLATGSLSGSIKIWDLSGSKEVRNFRGHKSAVTNLEFHNFGNFIATGSIDGNIKIWDVRSRVCIFTYRGHKDSINCMRFSPDGMWLASGSNDNIVKLWDLTAGKLMTEFHDHRAPITSIGFHPRDMLLATSSKDHTMKLYDLNDFKTIYSTNKSDCNSSIEKIHFHPENHAIYAATNDFLKIYKPEPLSCMETVTVGWQNGFRDMGFTSSLNQLIGVSVNDCTMTTHVVDIKSCPPFIKVDQSKASFPAKSHIPNETTKKTKTFCINSVSNERNFYTKHDKHQPVDDYDNKQELIEIQDQEECDRTFKNPDRFNRQELINPVLEKRQRSPQRTENNNSRSNTPNRKKCNEENKQANVAVNKDQKSENIGAAILPSGDITSDDGFINELLRMHTVFYKCLDKRQSKLSHLRKIWGVDKVSNTIVEAAKLRDPAIVVDLFAILCQNSHLITMDIAAIVLNNSLQLVTSKHLSHLEAACKILKIILKNYSHVIKENISNPPIKVDVNREERYQKCKNMYDNIQTLRNGLSTRTKGLHKSPLLNEVTVLLDILCE